MLFIQIRKQRHLTDEETEAQRGEIGNKNFRYTIRKKCPHFRATKQSHFVGDSPEWCVNYRRYNFLTITENYSCRKTKHVWIIIVYYLLFIWNETVKAVLIWKERAFPTPGGKRVLQNHGLGRKGVCEAAANTNGRFCIVYSKYGGKYRNFWKLHLCLSIDANGLCLYDLKSSLHMIIWLFLATAIGDSDNHVVDLEDFAEIGCWPYWK